MIYFGRKTIAEINSNSLVFLQLSQEDLKKLHESSLNFFVDLADNYTNTCDAKLQEIKQNLLKRAQHETRKVCFFHNLGFDPKLTSADKGTRRNNTQQKETHNPGPKQHYLDRLGMKNPSELLSEGRVNKFNTFRRVGERRRAAKLKD